MRTAETWRVIDPLPIYTMWLREMKRFFRMKTRVISSLLMPLFFLAFLGLPMRGFIGEMPGLPAGADFLDFIAPGIVGMTLLMSASMAGASLIWDKEFGFLKEVLVAPVDRLSIILGKSLGIMTTVILRAFIVVGIAVVMGVRLTGFPGFLLAVVFMILTCAVFTGIGLIVGTKLDDVEGFMMIMNLTIFPLFFLSGALVPMQTVPSWLRYLMYINPLTYGVDGLRGSLIGVYSLSPWLNLTVLVALTVAITALAAYFFSRMEAT